MAQISTDVNRPAVPAEGATLTAEVDVEPGDQEGAVTRHVALVIDASGSMSGAKIERARDGASWVFGLLEPEDFVTVVGFDTDAEVILPTTRWSRIDRDEAMDAVEELGAGGGTDLYGGLEAARDELAASRAGPDAVKRLLLLSDGKDNERGPEEFDAIAREIDDAGVRVQAAGIGEEYGAATIRTLGQTSRGSWTHLEGPGDIEDFFGDAVEAAGSVVASDARLELDAAPGVEVSEVYRQLPQAQPVDLDWADNAAVVGLPDLVEREHQRVVMKVHAPPRDDRGEVTLADVTLTAKGRTATDAITVTYTEDDSQLARHNEDVSLDHRETKVRTQLGRGDVESAETEIETMTKIHGADTQVVETVEQATQVVKEGGRAEREAATRIVDDERVEGS